MRIEERFLLCNDNLVNTVKPVTSQRLCKHITVKFACNLIVNSYQIVAVVLPVKRHRRDILCADLHKFIAELVPVTYLKCPAVLYCIAKIIEPHYALVIYFAVMRIKSPRAAVIHEILREHRLNLRAYACARKRSGVDCIDNQSCLINCYLVFKL